MKVIRDAEGFPVLTWIDADCAALERAGFVWRDAEREWSMGTPPTGVVIKGDSRFVQVWTAMPKRIDQLLLGEGNTLAKAFEASETYLADHLLSTARLLGSVARVAALAREPGSST